MIFRINEGIGSLKRKKIEREEKREGGREGVVKDCRVETGVWVGLLSIA